MVNRSSPGALETVRRYHQVTKHQVHRFAPGPGYLDWATQPDPFRRYAGASLIGLDKVPPAEEPRYDDAFVEGRNPPASMNRRSISQLFFDSLAISAWKSVGDARWALRVNPSSGNLHPTEGYLLCGPVDGLCAAPMVCHYAPKEHALEVRAEVDGTLWAALCERCPPATVFVGLTSVHWREAWKYGQRAYRYCQHDLGHSIAAVAIAAAALGWQTRLMDDLGTAELARLLGTDREHSAEPEEPDVLVAVGPVASRITERTLPQDSVGRFAGLQWRGTPNALSPDHLDWGTDAPAAAARRPRGPDSSGVSHKWLDKLAGARRPTGKARRGSIPPVFDPSKEWPSAGLCGMPRPGSVQPFVGHTTSPQFEEPRTAGWWPARPVPLRSVIRQRRSAVALDGQTRIGRDLFYRMLHKTVARPG